MNVQCRERGRGEEEGVESGRETRRMTLDIHPSLPPPEASIRTPRPQPAPRIPNSYPDSLPRTPMTDLRIRKSLKSQKPIHGQIRHSPERNNATSHRGPPSRRRVFAAAAMLT